MPISLSTYDEEYPHDDDEYPHDDDGCHHDDEEYPLEEEYEMCESEILNCVPQCLACGVTKCNTPDCVALVSNNTQKKILNQVRVPSSQLTNIKSDAAIGSDYITGDLDAMKYPRQHMSDRQIPHIQTRHVPRKRTRNIPGQLSPTGVGVDVKHGSYARYLGKLKAPIVSSVETVTPPKYGNKTTNFTLLNISRLHNNCKCYNLPHVPIAPHVHIEPVAPASPDESSPCDEPYYKPKKCDYVLTCCNKHNGNNYYKYHYYKPGKSI